jgi:hypothetical protein
MPLGDLAVRLVCQRFKALFDCLNPQLEFGSTLRKLLQSAPAHEDVCLWLQRLSHRFSAV